MSFGDYLILVHYILLIAFFPIFCKGKKKTTGGGAGGAQTPKVASAESVDIKSAIKPAITDPTPSAINPVKEDPKNEEAKNGEEKKKSGENKDGPGADGKGGAADGNGENGQKEESKESKERSLKPFPKFEMPTESKKKRKINDHEKDKKEKVKAGFYQEKSDEDDTLEKVDSLRVEQSDKTKRSQKKKKD